MNRGLDRGLNFWVGGFSFLAADWT